MSAGDVLVALASKGVELWGEDGRLRYRAPRGAVTREHLDALCEQKPSLLRFLADPDTLREAAARIIFDAEPEEEAARTAIEAMPVLVRCPACTMERNAGIAVCPVCHPAAGLPRRCRARTICSVLGRCDHRAPDGGCQVASAESEMGHERCPR